MNKNTPTEPFEDHYDDVASVSALEHNSFESNLQFLQSQNLREFPSGLTDTPQKSFLDRSPVKIGLKANINASANKKKERAYKLGNTFSPSMKHYESAGASRVNQHIISGKSAYQSVGADIQKSPQRDRQNQNVSRASPQKSSLKRKESQGNQENLIQQSPSKQVSFADMSFDQKQHKQCSKERRSRKNRNSSKGSQDVQSLINATQQQQQFLSPIKSPLANQTNQYKQDRALKQERMLNLNLQRVQVTRTYSASELFRMKVAAKKIQRIFRTYLLYKRYMMKREMSVERRRQKKLQKILSAKIIVRSVKSWLLLKKGRAVRKFMVDQIRKIQRFFKVCLIKNAINKRIWAKSMIYSLFIGWKIRRIINSLAPQIQQYVNCDDKLQKQKLKNKFLSIYDHVVNSNLWLQDNEYKLKRYIRQQNEAMKARMSTTKTPIRESQKFDKNQKLVQDKSPIDAKQVSRNQRSIVNSSQQNNRATSANTAALNQRQQVQSLSGFLTSETQNAMKRSSGVNSSIRGYDTSQAKVTLNTSNLQHNKSYSSKHGNVARDSQASTNIHTMNTTPREGGQRAVCQQNRKAYNAQSKIDCWRNPPLQQNYATSKIGQGSNSLLMTREVSPIITTVNQTFTNTSQIDHSIHLKRNKEKQASFALVSENSFDNRHLTTTATDEGINGRLIKVQHPYKVCLNQLEKLMDDVHGLSQRNNLTLGQKSKFNTTFNRLVNELKDQYNVISQCGVANLKQSVNRDSVSATRVQQQFM